MGFISEFKYRAINRPSGGRAKKVAEASIREQELNMCWHAAAAKHFTLADEQWVTSLCANHMYEHIDQVKLQHDAVTPTSGSTLCNSDLVLAVCTADSGWPVTVVGADSSGDLLFRSPACCNRSGLKHKCQDCEAVDQWLSGIEAEVNMLEQTTDNPRG